MRRVTVVSMTESLRLVGSLQGTSGEDFRRSPQRQRSADKEANSLKSSNVPFGASGMTLRCWDNLSNPSLLRVANSEMLAASPITLIGSMALLPWTTSQVDGDVGQRMADHVEQGDWWMGRSRQATEFSSHVQIPLCTAVLRINFSVMRLVFSGRCKAKFSELVNFKPASDFGTV